MNPRRPLVSLGLGTLALAVPLVALMPIGCGGYESDPETGGTGGSAQGATGGAGGSVQAGTGGSGPAGTGGSGPAGMGGTGQAGTGGSAQAGTGGSALGGMGATSGMGGSAAGSGGASGAGGSSGSAGAGEASCDDVAPCGGDLVGTWTVVDCPQTVGGEVNMESLGLGCSAAPVEGSLGVSGTLTFNADLTYADNTMTTGMSAIELPASCLMVSGTTTTCAKADNGFTSVGYATGAVCEDNTETGGCSCTATVAQTGGFGLPSVEPGTSGTYEVAGNQLTMEYFGTDTLYSYCVSGSTATVTLESLSKTGTATGPIVLQKQ